MRDEINALGKHERKSDWMKVFSVIFTAVFSLTIFNIIFNKRVYAYSTAVLIVFGAMFLFIMLLLYKLLRKKESFFVRHYNLIVVFFFTFTVAIQIFFAAKMKVHLMYDFEAVYNHALEWVSTGTFGQYSSPTSAVDYFYIFPNNLGVLAFLTSLFKIASLFGISNMFLVAVTANSFIIVTTMCLTSFICRRLWGVTYGLLALILYLAGTPFYFFALVFYTDFLTIIYPVLIFYLFLKSQDTKKALSRTVIYLIIGFISAVGFLIKVTTGIVLIAIVIYLILKYDIKRAVLFLGFVFIIISCSMFLFNQYMYTTHLDKEKAERERIPYTHWVMMGVGGVGQYDNDDFRRTRLTTDPVERSEKIKKIIIERLSDLGPVGLINLFETKLTRCFGDGTFELHHNLGFSVAEKNVLHEFFFSEGRYHSPYRHFYTAAFVSMLVLMLLPAVNILRQKRKSSEVYILIPQLCLLGLALFLMIWEANNRFIINYIPMVVIPAMGGVDYIAARWLGTNPA